MGTSLAFAIELLGQVPALIAAGRDVVTLVQTGKGALEKMQTEGRDPTDAEWDELNAQIKALQDELHS